MAFILAAPHASNKSSTSLPNAQKFGYEEFPSPKTEYLKQKRYVIRVNYICAKILLPKLTQFLPFSVVFVVIKILF
jgi:hypothetical protein